MTHTTLTIAQHIQDGAQTPASSFAPTNFKATSAGMPLGVLTDVPTFSGTTVTGTWTLASMNASVSGIGLLHAVSTGVGYTSTGVSSGPMTIKPGNQNVLCR